MINFWTVKVRVWGQTKVRWYLWECGNRQKNCVIEWLIGGKCETSMRQTATMLEVFTSHITSVIISGNLTAVGCKQLLTDHFFETSISSDKIKDGYFRLFCMWLWCFHNTKYLITRCHCEVWCQSLWLQLYTDLRQIPWVSTSAGNLWNLIDAPRTLEQNCLC